MCTCRYEKYTIGNLLLGEKDGSYYYNSIYIKIALPIT